MSKKEMKKEIKSLNKRLHEAFEEIEALNKDLDTYKAKSKQEFNDWMLDHHMTELISGLTYERQLMADAVRSLGLRMGSVSTFLEAVCKRVPKADDVINGVKEKIAKDPSRRYKENVQ